MALGHRKVSYDAGVADDDDDTSGVTCPLTEADSPADDAINHPTYAAATGPRPMAERSCMRRAGGIYVGALETGAGSSPSDAEASKVRTGTATMHRSPTQAGGQLESDARRDCR